MDRSWNHNSHYYGLVLDALPRPGSALDVGCGEGTLCRLLAGRAGSVLGIDSSEGMIAQARSLSTGHPRADYVCGDFLTAPLEGPFDLISAVAAVHHMPLTAALTRMKGLLAPGGVIVIVGLAASRSLADYAVDAVAVPAARVYHLTRGEWDPGAPLADPTTSYADVRAAADRLLPGAVYSRHLLFRYSLVWRSPAAS